MALVTGAAGIVGPGICRELQEAGWKVVAADYNEACFARHDRMHSEPVPADLRLTADLSNREECRHLVAEASHQIGPIGLLVNNATGFSRREPLAEIDEAACKRVFGVDVLAPLYLSQAATEDLALTQGLIVNISSVRINNVVPCSLLYFAAKAAVEKMTEALAVELSPRKIRVNAIRIGAIPGDAFLRVAIESIPPSLGAELYADILPRHLEDSRGHSLTGKVGRPSDIGRIIAYLASPAGEFINGAILPVDGGYSLVQQQRAATAFSGGTVAQQWITDTQGELQKWLKERENQA